MNNSFATPNLLIKSALNEAIREINKGATPTDALVKSAKKYELNANFIQRTGEALNTGLGLKHFKEASDKSTAFPMADIKQATKEALAFADKPIKKQTHDMFGIADDSVDFNKILTNPKYKASAAAFLTAFDEDEPRQMSKLSLMEKASTYVRDLEKQANDVRTKKASASYKTDSCFSKLVHHFKKSAQHRNPFAEFESQVFAKYGSESVDYLDLLFKAAAPKNDERGVHDDKYFAFEELPEVGMFDDLMKASSAQIEIEKQALEIDKELDEAKEQLKEVYASVGDGLKKKSNNSESVESKEDDSEKGESGEKEKEESSDKKEESVVDESKSPESVEGESQELMSDAELGKQAADIISALLDRFKAVDNGFKSVKPLHNPQDNFTRKRILQELLLTDEILKQVNPRKVAQAYEVLLQLAPQMSLQKEVVRAFLRQAVQAQGVSPFDANQLIMSNTNLAKQKLMLQGLGYKSDKKQ